MSTNDNELPKFGVVEGSGELCSKEQVFEQKLETIRKSLLNLVNDYYKDPPLLRYLLESEINDLFTKLSNTSEGGQISMDMDRLRPTNVLPTNVLALAELKQKISDELIVIVKAREEPENENKPTLRDDDFFR
jgi:hypothetical protein